MKKITTFLLLVVFCASVSAQQTDERKPAKTSEKTKIALLKARQLLQKDQGKLWGKNLWHENVLFQDRDDTIYSLKKLEGSKTDDSILFYKTLPKNTLSKTNTVQTYNGEKYATIVADDFYMNDESATVIHELFHRLHFEELDQKNIKLKTEPVSYLDNFDARELLRLEFEALRNTLNLMDKNEDKSKIDAALADALLFRKARQNKYRQFLKEEIEIETVEGLASYTGFALSTYPNKYKRAISSLHGWETSPTYTRPFPYATGPAYGLIFDHLNLDWKTGFDKIYNFLEIYESKYLKKPLALNHDALEEAKSRNNYPAIHKEELARKLTFENRVKFYTELLVNKPTLQATLASSEYTFSFDMNGTLSLGEFGTLYSGAKGTDLSDNNFGNFEIDPAKAKLGVTGVLSSKWGDKTKYTFPLPSKITDGKIIGEFYEIELNDGWVVKKKNAKGDLEIVKEETKASKL
ncbi:MAG: hypothetical protein HKN25_04075 [Pyrinomonadaceae bacterium]|nr:hypothetical protein [Pyrinomonadaceae bacterium]